MTADKILEQAAITFKEKNKEYGENWRFVGPVFKCLFPNGIKLNSENDFNRFHILMLIIVKLTRYASNWDEGHQDSIHDACIYSAILEQIDSENKLDIDDLQIAFNFYDEDKSNSKEGIAKPSAKHGDIDRYIRKIAYTFKELGVSKEVALNSIKESLKAEL